MTALLVLERTDPDDTVRIAGDAVSSFGSSLGVVAGERLSVRDLLYGMLLASANDAAVALADHVGGTQAKFVSMMNRRAGGLGLQRTEFASPNGLDDRGHSTARDLADLTRRALGEPLFARVVRTKAHDVPPAPGSSSPRHVQNRDVLLWLYPGATGVKTGFTTPAGHCLIATASRRNRRLLAVVLGSPVDAFSDGAALLNYGFSGWEPRTVVEAQEPVGTARADGQPVSALAAEDFAALVRTDGSTTVTRSFRPLDPLHLPIEAGEVIGHLTVRAGGAVLGEIEVVAGTTVAAPTPPAHAPVDPGTEPWTGRELAGVGVVLRAAVRSVFGSFL